MRVVLRAGPHLTLQIPESSIICGRHRACVSSRQHSGKYGVNIVVNIVVNICKHRGKHSGKDGGNHSSKHSGRHGSARGMPGVNDNDNDKSSITPSCVKRIKCT